jgi:hypothetical protein
MTIFVAFPAYGRMNVADTTASLFELGVTFGMNGLYGGFGTATHPDISEIRNVFLTAFYDKTRADHILFVDSDMKFRAKLVIDMLKLDQPVVGAVYRKKSNDRKWIGRALPEEQKPVDGFMEMAGVGAGVLLIRRDCVETMIKEFPDLIDSSPPEAQQAREQVETLGLTRVFRAFDKMKNEFGNELSEDLAFCERWRSIGGQVWANVSHEIGHIGLAEFKGSYLNQLSQSTLRP